MEYRTISFDNCARCGQPHAGLVARRFERAFSPPECAPLSWTYWAACPTNGDPVLIAICDTDKIPAGRESYEGTWYAHQIALAKQRDSIK